MPANEAERLVALAETQLLDSEHEAVFDAIVALAASICGVPMAAITLIDRDRQWFKASVGIGDPETPREDAFCTYTILHPDALEVDDATSDERFRNNPFVLGDAHVRFYAGMPLTTGSGHALGALCVIDRAPRQLSNAQRESLRHLTTVVERLIDARTESLRQQKAVRDSEERMARGRDFIRKITDAMPALILYLDREQLVRFANADVGRRFDVDATTLIGRSFAEICGADLYAEIQARLLRAFAGETVSFEGHRRLRDQFYHHRTHYLPDVAADGHVQGVFALSFDITAQKQAEIVAQTAERRLQLIADNIPAAVSIIDRDHVYRFNNAVYERVTGKPLAEITGRPIREIIGEEVYAQTVPHLERALAGHRTQFEFRQERDDGPRFLRGTYQPKRDEAGHVVGVFGMLLDQTELKQAEDQLRVMAEFDALTKLANRYRLYDVIALSGARAQRHGGGRALLYLDVDKFKSINDRHGHAGGDAVLVEFSRRLKAAVRATDTVARLAGDEFVVLLEDVREVGDAERVADAIHAAMRPPVRYIDTDIAVGTSIGIAFNTDPGEDADAWLHRADGALYSAKAAGRGSYRVAAEV
jgi:diguanylate cyclase (GGDEF)-like protein/PAS domain S-box-containing protein